jgi:arylformamidase
MAFFDISATVSPGLPVWPGDPPIAVRSLSSIAAGDPANVSHLSAGVHIGTHVDAPLHFIDGGSTADELPLGVLIGEAWVVDVGEAATIDAEVLEGAGIEPAAERLLFKTRNQQVWAGEHRSFHKEYVAVDESGARWLVEHGVRLVGIDYLSIAPWKETPDLPTHQAGGL